MVLGVGELDVAVPVGHEPVRPHVQCWWVELVAHGSAYFEFHLSDLDGGVSVVSGFGEVP